MHTSSVLENGSQRPACQTEMQGLSNPQDARQPKHTDNGEEKLLEDIRRLPADCSRDVCRGSSPARSDWTALALGSIEAAALVEALEHRDTLFHAATLQLALSSFVPASPSPYLPSV